MDSRYPDIPSVRMEVRESIDKYTVRHEADFPIARTTYAEMYLDAVSGSTSRERTETVSQADYAAKDGKLSSISGLELRPNLPAI